MSGILANLQSPHWSWVSVVRNFIKYSGLRRLRFLASRSHMLFVDHVVCSGAVLFTRPKPNFKVLIQVGRRPNYFSFEYIPFLPRLRAWLRNSTSADTLFKYRRGSYAAENALAVSYNGSSDYFEGALDKPIVENWGGDHAYIFDFLFLNLLVAFLCFKAALMR